MLKKKIRLGPKLPHLDWNWKNEHPRLCQTAKFHLKQKILKLGTINALLGYFEARIWKKKLLPLFEISAFEFVRMQSSMLKGEKLNYGPILPNLGIFGLKFEKTLDFVKLQSSL